MQTSEFIEMLRRLNFYLIANNGRLILKGNTKRLTAGEIESVKSNNDIIGYIKDHRNELIEYLSQSSGYDGAKRSDKVSSIYRLSRLQEGMLFHGLYGGASGNYVQQFRCDLLNV